MKVIALIVAAGGGSRFGGLPKQFQSFGGRPLISFSFQSFQRCADIDRILFVIGEDQADFLNDAIGEVAFVFGGATRRESVLNGLEQIAADGGADVVLIHDAARPIVPTEIITNLLSALDKCRGAAPVLFVADTLARGEIEKSSDGGVLLTIGDSVDRSELLRVQTPQAFSFDTILEAHRAWPKGEDATDDVQVFRRFGERVAMIVGDSRLEKVTHPIDGRAAEERIEASLISRTGMGFDVHAFAGEGPIMMGGIEIPYERGLAGHSDADVVLHAITDALLGAAGLGDIGTHFPPSDPQWKGAASAIFLAHAARLIRVYGGIIDFVDCTVIGEAPRVGPYRAAMRSSVAAILGLTETRVSIKATTTEKLGFAGRGEGLAAQAVATIRMGE